MTEQLSRRHLLRAAGGVGVAALVPLAAGGCTESDTADEGDGRAESPHRDAVIDTEVFAHGVASGDPTPHAVILWTRVTSPDGSPLDVGWEVSTDAEFRDVVASGTVTADADSDHTVKIDAEGLEPATEYHYRFVTDRSASPPGQTRTVSNAELDNVRFGVVSCANFPFGLFHAYRHLAERGDLDAVLHLGDYIYEYGPDGGYPGPDDAQRPFVPAHEIVTLDDYRARYGQYRTDPDLQQLHAAVPFVTVWDDHEHANNSWSGGAAEHDPATHGSWADRRAAATQAYYEWLPVRGTPDDPLYRHIGFGDLVDLFMLDTRIEGREQQSGSAVVDANDPSLPDQLLGSEQEDWLFAGLSESEATWRVLGQQVMMSLWRLGEGAYANNDQWNGYPGARRRLIDHVRDDDIDNLVVLTGDVHSSWAIDVTDETADYDAATGAGAVAAEFVTPGVTSPAGDTLEAFTEGIRSTSPTHPVGRCDPQRIPRRRHRP